MIVAQCQSYASLIGRVKCLNRERLHVRAPRYLVSTLSFPRASSGNVYPICTSEKNHGYPTAASTRVATGYTSRAVSTGIASRCTGVAERGGARG